MQQKKTELVQTLIFSKCFFRATSIISTLILFAEASRTYVVSRRHLLFFRRSHTHLVTHGEENERRRGDRDMSRGLHS